MNGLTLREKQIFKLVSQGDINRVIARKLGIAEQTVKNHRSNAYRALDTNNGPETVMRVYSNKELV